MISETKNPETVDLRSLNISAENREKLKQLFPSVFTETRNEKGELAESIDFEKLKAELGAFSDVFESRRERYGMDWPGKKDCLPEQDLGFKFFKLDKSNFKIWDGANPNATEEEIAQQLTLHVDHIDPAATQEDILYELLLKAGFMPTQKVEKLELTGKTVFSIAEGALLICLDQGFLGNDQLKANAVQTFAARNQGRDKTQQIVFRTV